VRARVMSSRSFTGYKIAGAIFAEQTMDRGVNA
jgi:fructose-bisphosphate aldolase class 1